MNKFPQWGAWETLIVYNEMTRSLNFNTVIKYFVVSASQFKRSTVDGSALQLGTGRILLVLKQVQK